MMIPVLSIRLGIDPILFEVGQLMLSWHGVLTFVSVALAVFLVGRWSKKEGLDTEGVYSTATWAIIGGILGARLLHIVDYWDKVYGSNPGQIIEFWRGGIAIYGAILGGFVGGAAYLLIRNHPKFIGTWNYLFRFAKLAPVSLPSVGRLADITAPAMLIAMALGRVGDIINGEHVAKLTTLPWGIIYTHPDSPSNQVHGFSPSHPAVVYEMIWDLAVLGVIWSLRNRFRPHGMLFALYLAMYSVGRFFISFLRTGPPPMDEAWIIGLTEAHVVALIVLVVTVPLLVVKAQLVAPVPGARGAKATRKR